MINVLNNVFLFQTQVTSCGQPAGSSCLRQVTCGAMRIRSQTAVGPAPSCGAAKCTYLFKIKRTPRFAYEINNFYRRDLPFGGHHVCPIHGVPCKCGKYIFNIKVAVLIFQKDPFFHADHVTVHSH